MRFEFRSVRGMLGILACLLSLALCADDLRADDGSDIVSYFKRMNPVSQLDRFAGVKIYMLYSCVEGRGVTDETACTNLRKRARFQDAIVPIRTRYQERDALNFLVSETDYRKTSSKIHFLDAQF